MTFGELWTIPLMEVRFVNTNVPPGRAAVRESFSLTDFSLLNQALWALLKELPWAFVLPRFVNTDWSFSPRTVGSRVGNVVTLPAASPTRVPSCFGEMAGGWASALQPLTVGST